MKMQFGTGRLTIIVLSPQPPKFATTKRLNRNLQLNFASRQFLEDGDSLVNAPFCFQKLNLFIKVEYLVLLIEYLSFSAGGGRTTAALPSATT
jgi:hypothetical protein